MFLAFAKGIMTKLSLADLNERSREILRLVVDSYVESGEPVGSRTLARRLERTLSPATIRNVMADLQDMGLLYSPHTSAGRLPTGAGLKLFVNGLLEVGNLSDEEQRDIAARCAAAGHNMPSMLEQAGEMLSGLSTHASFVIAPSRQRAIAHIEFVRLAETRALVIIVDDRGQVENRIMELPAGMPVSALIQASNFLQARLQGRTLADEREAILQELEQHRSELDELAARVVQSGLAVRLEGDAQPATLVVKGQAQLLNGVAAVDDLHRLQSLFEVLERKESLLQILDATEKGEGVQIFIGAEHELFALSGWSMVLAPLGNQKDVAGQEKVVGAVGVIGPMRLNYARIVPMVDYTAQVIRRILG
jgi:heat-inducible transcriptional repressor